MSQRRLFSPDIVDSDAFLNMPGSSQLLYFHLAMRADDDGFVSPRKVMRMIGVADDDLKILIAKRFVLPFESGVVVIKHWLIHNTIRKDRYHETKYLAEKATLVVKENGSYTELATKWQPNGNQMVPEVKLSKVKLINNTIKKEELNTNFLKFWKQYPKKVGKSVALRIWNKLTQEEQTIILRVLPQHIGLPQWSEHDGKYIPYPSTWLNQRRWEDELKGGRITV